MKKTIFILGLLFFAFMQISCNKNDLTETNSSLITTQQKNSKIKDSDVPSAVLNSFTNQYPSTKVKSWEYIDPNYLASFTYNGSSMSALFNLNGSLLETTTEILESQLPKSCTDYCAKYYTGFTIKFAARVVDAVGRVFYQAEVDKTLLLFDSSGNFIRIIV